MHIAPTIGDLSVRCCPFCASRDIRVSALDFELYKIGKILALIVIRADVIAKSLGVDLLRAVDLKSKYNESRPYMHGKKA